MKIRLIMVILRQFFLLNNRASNIIKELNVTIFNYHKNNSKKHLQKRRQFSP